MKTRCKNVKLDYEFVSYWTYDFLHGDYKRNRRAKWLRRDFQRLLADTNNVSYKEVKDLVKYHNTLVLKEYSDKIALQVFNNINSFLLGGNLEIPKIDHFMRYDTLSGKNRRCCLMQPIHQIMEYIGLRALTDLLNAKIEYYQCASVLHKGQVFGKQAIERWVRREKIEYYIQCDIVKCFQSISCKKVINLLKRDIGKNIDLVRYIEALLSVYDNGMLEIGTILSASLCNYALSYAYRYSHTISYQRRNKTYPSIKHVLTFMDDFIFVGNNKKELCRAVKLTEQYLQDFLGIGFHKWEVYNIHDRPIDMMGYVIAYDYTKIRYRIYKRAKRQYVRADIWLRHNEYLNNQRAYKVSSYYGYFKHTNSRDICNQLSIYPITSKARKTIAHMSKEECNVSINII